MGGWQGQLGRCLLGIYLIGLALSLYQPDPLVALPAGWGGVLGLLTTKAILSLSANAPDAASMWISGSIDRKSVVMGKSVSVRVDLGGRGILKKKTNRIY